MKTMNEVEEAVVNLAGICKMAIEEGSAEQPMASMRIVVEGKPYILCVMHPGLHEKMINSGALVVDPRSSL
jgi:hypothetical protein